ncbi:MAG: MBL fold metallo-hydrolase [Firmicutes bacterium]|nr:MBL fold metallo-hydrolase [Bacillota bacterium]
MRLQQFVLGELKVNTYLLWDEETLEAVCLDPGGPVQEIFTELEKEKLNLKYIVLTHGHYDHILGVNALKAATKAPVLIHSADAAMLANPALNLSNLFGTEVTLSADRLLTDGEILCLGAKMIKVEHTPGHSPGSISLTLPGLIFAGDLLFAGSIGRTDLPGGDQETLRHSLSKLLKYPNETRVFPGHGPDTMIGREKLYNPFLQNLVVE